MDDKPNYYDRQTILSLCPAPPGARLAYAQEDVEGGIWYEPCYFVAVCEGQRWVQHPPFDARSRHETHGEPTREVLPVSWDRDGVMGAHPAANLLAYLMPGQELDETAADVIAARRAALNRAALGAS